MKFSLYLLIILFPAISFAQAIDTSVYEISVDTSKQYDHFFTHDPIWRGADGAASVDMGNGRVLWLFSDSFISLDSPFSRKKSVFVRNSVAIQQGYDIKTASLKFYWDRSGKKPKDLFWLPGKGWFWTGHGIMVKDKLLVFLMKEYRTKKGLGFEAKGWYAVLISNPDDDPSQWKMKYMEGPDTYGLIVGSAAVLKDEQFIYAFGAVEPATHEVYVLRWPVEKIYREDISSPEWWIDGQWIQRKTRLPVPAALFTGQTEFSVHYDPTLKKYLQFQSFGFGDAEIGLRMADSLQGPWTNPYILCKPTYPGVKQGFMYSVKAHPELKKGSIVITYNVNSFDFGELLNNQLIYFPGFVRVKITKKSR